MPEVHRGGFIKSMPAKQYHHSTPPPRSRCGCASLQRLSDFVTRKIHRNIVVPVALLGLQKCYVTLLMLTIDGNGDIGEGCRLCYFGRLWWMMNIIMLAYWFSTYYGGVSSIVP